MLPRKLAQFENAKIITRFAPSPTGYLHLGHIASALWVWGVTHMHSGKVILRIEDHDESRSRQPYIEAIIEDLNWLGFTPDLGLSKDMLIQSDYRQSQLKEKYFAWVETLLDNKQAYYCRCSRKEILARQSQKSTGELRYDGHCSKLNLGPNHGKHSIRIRTTSEPVKFTDLNMGDQIQNPFAQCGDFTLVDRDQQATYQLACVFDDLTQGVNLVIRGMDLLHATGRQIYLRSILAPSLPKVRCANSLYFLHHPLVLDDQSGQKLSKRQFSESIRQLREQGYASGELLNIVARKMGWPIPELKKEAKAQDVFQALIHT